jgi:DNA-binding CsgD family transcriptional regulator
MAALVLSSSSSNLGRLLSKGEALACLEIIHRSLSCRNGQDLSKLLAEVGDLMGVEHCAGLFASRKSSYEPPRILFADSTAPKGWLDLYSERQFHLIDPIVIENFSRFSIQYWEDTYLKSPPPKDFVHLAEDFGLKQGITYGFKEGDGAGGSLFSFSGGNLKKHGRNSAILDQIIPHLHRVLCQLEPNDLLQPPKPSLSEREMEVLKWTGAGKSSWEIGMILNISERTVNFHIKNILKKLDAVNRPQAVAMALKLGLLSLP